MGWFKQIWSRSRTTEKSKLAYQEKPDRVDATLKDEESSDNLNLVKKMQWRRDDGGDGLTGGLVELADGSLRMSVDGFVTSRELYEVYNLTPALIRKFLPTPDVVALFEYGDTEAPGCDLYAENRVKEVLNTEQFRTEWAKTERRREAARKGNAKRRETYENKLKQEEEARAAFGGQVYVARCTYTYGWIELSAWAKDNEQAEVLFRRWLKSEECQDVKGDLFDDAIDRYHDALEEYREELRFGLDAEESLHKPVRPKKSEFTLEIESVRATELSTDDHDMEEVCVEDENEGWVHNVRDLI